MTHKELITQMLDALIKASALLDMRGTAYSDVDEAINVSTEYLAAPEQSEPVAMLEITVRGGTTTIDNHFSAAVMGWPAGEYQLYTHPAPKAPKPLTSGWLTACDEEMIGAHLGVANLSDSYESAKAKLRTLIDWHVAVAADPAVNGKPSSQPKAEPVNQQLLEALKMAVSFKEGGKEMARAAIAAAEQAPQPTSLTSLLKHKDVQAALLAAQKEKAK